MSTKFDPRSVKIQFLSEVAHYLLHLYNGAPQLPGERVTSDDEDNRQYVWYRFVRNRDYNQLERTSPNPDSCLNDIITENYPLLLPAFGAQSRVGEHAFGVSEDKTYHHYFLLLPPKDELVLDDDSKGSPDKFLRKLVKRAQAFLKQFANGPPPPPPSTDGVVATTATVATAVAAVAAPPVQSQLVPPLRSAVAAAPTQPTQPAAAAATTTTTTTTNTTTTTHTTNTSDVVVLAAVKRDRTAMEQAAQDQAELKALKTDELAVKRARLAEEAKRKAEAKAQRERDEQERAAKAEADELARIAAEQERLEKERQARIAECPFPKRAPGTVGFVQAPFQTADGMVVNPWFLL
jgi:hypothetical protein